MKNIFLAFLLLSSTLANAQTIFELIDQKDYAKLRLVTKRINGYNDRGQFPLFYATIKNDTTAFNILVANGANVNQLTRFGNSNNNATCMTFAAQEGYMGIVKTLLDNNVNIESREEHGCTPLRIAARNGQTDLVKYLISKGAEIDTKANDGATPLEHAAAKGHIDIIELLLQHGANINHQDKELDTPIGEAAAYGHFDTVKYLLSKGANKNLRNKNNLTAADRARNAGQRKVVELLSAN